MTLKDCIAIYNKESRLVSFESEALYGRQSPVHATASALVFNEGRDKVLFAFHKIYRSYAWLGGNNDGEKDFLAVALREAKEESGLKELTLFSRAPLHVGLLPVAAHVRRGEKVEAHEHLNVTFGFIASEREALTVCEEENSALAWLPVKELDAHCSEPHMLPIYRECLAAARELSAEKAHACSVLPERLLPWYDLHRRDLPWRRDISAYRTWVSEIMLQQTRVEAGKSYFLRFLRELPTVFDLAACPEDKLLKLWEGLGYYNRAKNMKKAAEIIVERYGGVFPSSVEELTKLPGVGEYTAGAIASIAYGEREPAVDGNVVRVISRVTEDYRVDPRREIAAQLRAVYPERAGDFTQSLMEIGALVCIPNGAPLCEQCPLREDCLSRRFGCAGLLPVLPEKRARSKKKLCVFVIETPEGTALRKRSEKGVLRGMWEYPNVEVKEFPEKAEIPAEYGLKNAQILEVFEYTHVFTHLEWEMRCYRIQADGADIPCYSRAYISEHLSIPSAFARAGREQKGGKKR